MTSIFALFLLLSLGFAAAVAFATAQRRRKLKVLLVVSLLLAWVTLGAALSQISARTASTLVAPGAARRPGLVRSAAHEAFTLAGALGGPAILVTTLGVFALRATRKGRPVAQPRRRRGKPARIVHVRPDGQHLEDARRLIEEYGRTLELDHPGQVPAAELAGLPGEYAPPRGRLLIAHIGRTTAGCVALRSLDARTAEMKRLYVRPPFRHVGLGRVLVETACKEARRLGYERLRLDTLPLMKDAIALYRSLGFHEIPAYRDDALPGSLFLERPL
ncbi:MAG TPA: GNAT family N-acetyltransferase [Myxococcales bacterium]|nr:GNAT family N-acetyltransferase [Myxococcales bacterium]